MKKLLLLAALYLGFNSTYAQGLLFDEEEYLKVEEYDTDEFGFVSNPPTRYSLLSYAPTPILQDGGTCVSVSTSYGALTIAYNKKFGVKNVHAHFHSFQPYFMYSNLKDDFDYYCNNGISIASSMDFLVQRGGFKLWSPIDIMCNQRYDQELLELCSVLSNPYKVRSCSRIPFELYSKTAKKANQFKGVLAEGKPIVIGMHYANSFEDCEGKDLWDPSSSELKNLDNGHAMVVLAYDDNKYGGAFQIMNSWGTDWGNGGFIWVKYDDFFRYLSCAFTINLYSGFNEEYESGYAYGRYKWDSGATYEGQTYKDYLHGFGIKSFGDYIYCGTFSYGDEDGIGYIVNLKDNSLYLVQLEKGKITSSEQLGFAADDEDPVYELIKENYKALLETGNFIEGDIDDLDDDLFDDDLQLKEAEKVEDVDD